MILGRGNLLSQRMREERMAGESREESRRKVSGKPVQPGTIGRHSAIITIFELKLSNIETMNHTSFHDNCSDKVIGF